MQYVDFSTFLSLLHVYLDTVYKNNNIYNSSTTLQDFKISIPCYLTYKDTEIFISFPERDDKRSPEKLTRFDLSFHFNDLEAQINNIYNNNGEENES